MPIKNVYFCLQHKEEIHYTDVEDHLVDNPGHHIVECLRTDTEIQPGSEPVVTSLLPGSEDEALGGLVQLMGSGGQLVEADHCLLTFFESSLRGNEWAGISGNTDVEQGHVMPFDGKIVGLTVAYTRIRRSVQSLEIHIGHPDSSQNPYTTPWLFETNDSGTWAIDTLDIDASIGTLIRVKGGFAWGYIEDAVISVLVKKT